MSWCLFLPLTYLTMGLDQVCAGDLAWKGAAPSFLLLLWSVIAVRSHTSRAMCHAFLLGLVADLMTNRIPGVSAAVFVTVIFLLGRIRTEEDAGMRRWLLWSFPLMLLALGTIHASEWLLQSLALSPQLLIRQTLLTAAVTFGWGAVMKVLWGAMRQLFRFPRAPVPRELDTGSFFLSR